MNKPLGPMQDPQPRGDRETDREFALSARDLARVRDGDRVALSDFFNAAFDLVYGLAYRLTGNHHAAEDVTQEVFLRVHRALGKLDPERDPRPWLRTITANICRDRWRSFEGKVDRKGVSRDDEDAAPTLASDAPAPDAGLLAAEAKDAVQLALGALPEDLREVVILRDFEGLDHQEIADMLGVSHAAARKRYSRALTRLGELLKGKWP